MFAEANIEVIWAFVIIASIIGQLVKAAKRGTERSSPGTPPGESGSSRPANDELREFLESIGQRVAPSQPPPPPPPSSAATASRPAALKQVARRESSSKVRPVAPPRPKPASTQRHVAPSQMRQTPGSLNNRPARKPAPPVAVTSARVNRSPAVALRVASETAYANRPGKEVSRTVKRSDGTVRLRRALHNDLYGPEAIQRAVLLREILGPPPGLGPLRG